MVRNKITIEQCPCSKACSYWFLKGIGSFVQGSGFSKEEARLIARLLNAHNEKYYGDKKKNA